VTGRVVCGGRAVSPLMQREACKKVTFAPEYQSISETSSDVQWIAIRLTV